jgi:hypothetical protein
MIPRMAPSPERGLYVSIHVGGSRIDKDQIQSLVKQIPILKVKLLLQRLSKIRKKAHPTVKMLKLDLLESRSLDCLDPAAPLQIAPRLHQPLQTQRKTHSLQIEFQTTTFPQTLQNTGNPLPLPESSKDQSGSPEFRRTRTNIGGLGGFYDAQSLRKTAKTLDQTIELSLSPKLIEAPQGDKDSLPDRWSLSISLYNLQIVMRMSQISTTFNPNKHADKLACLLY